MPKADIPAFNLCLAEVVLDYGITLCRFVEPIGAEFGCSLQRFEVDVHRTENTKARNCQLAPVSLGVKTSSLNELIIRLPLLILRRGIQDGAATTSKTP